MSININARSDVSFLFSSLGSSASKVGTSNFLGDYASIKNGSYAKLMKAYFRKDGNDTVKSVVNDYKKVDKVESKEAKALTKVQSTTDSLKESADALLEKGSKSVFQMKDITTTDENGVEDTRKGYDVNAIYKAVNSFVNDYNAVIDATDNVSDKTISNRVNYMTGATYSNRNMLGQLGVTIGKDGKLSLDKDTFMKADMGKAKNLFQGSGSYGYQVSSQASMINYSADRAALKADTYTTRGTYNNKYNSGKIFNSYF